MIVDRVVRQGFCEIDRYVLCDQFLCLRIEFFQCANGKQVLELGTNSWSVLERNEIKPASLYGINISENELELGIQKAETTFLSPRFLLMDANRLAFKDNTFDVVFGGGILHHLDCKKKNKN